MFKINKYTILFLITIPFAKVSMAANCKADERAEADARLKAIAQDDDIQKTIAARHLPFGIHESLGDTSGELVLYQDGYVMLHDEDLKTSLWSSYKLTGDDREAAAGKPRVNCFRKDPRLKKSLTATPTDYDEAIYDQGHMTNDADLKDEFIEQLNTYVMSNMSPQHCTFNRGIWLSLEHLTRAWADKDVYNELYVTSGAIFDRDDKLGRDLDVDARRMESRNNGFRVGVPSHYYKVLVRKDGGKYKSIAFLLEHNNDNDGTKWKSVKPDVVKTITSISDIEARAGVKLHPDLDRSQLEEFTNWGDWDFTLGLSNLAGGLKPGNSCVDTLPQ